MTKLKITVTKEILEESKHCRSEAQFAVTSCAISRAVRDIFPKARVWSSHINPQTGDVNDNISLPTEAKKFIADFDKSLPIDRVNMDPISFDVELPDSLIEKINIEELRPLLTNHPTLELV